MLKRFHIRKITILLIIFYFILETMVMATTSNLYGDTNLQYESIDESGNLKIYSESAILIEKETGKILYEKNAYDKKYPASTTKILTAIIAIEKCDLNEKVTASKSAVFSVKSGYSIADIQVGETFSVRDLLEVMMLQSANEAANILAEHISGSIEEFAKLMNKKAREIGCKNTHFVNANGAHDENHYSTAYDMAQIASYCMKNDIFKKIGSKMECSLPTTDIWQKERNFKNTNSLMNPTSRYYYKYCTGLKTGYTTPARNCLISTSNKNGFELISVILHAETTEDGLSARYLDTISLFNYGYKNFKIEDIYEEYNLIGHIDNSDKDDFSKENINYKEMKKSSFVNKYTLLVFLGIVILNKINKKYKRNTKSRHSYSNSYSKMYSFKYDL